MLATIKWYYVDLVNFFVAVTTRYIFQKWVSESIGWALLVLSVITFSSNCSIVIFDDQENITTISSSLDLIHVQNVYVTMLWKYLIYLYGFKEATLRFSSIVKSIIDVTRMLESMPENITHDLMVETIVAETQRSLLIEDWIRLSLWFQTTIDYYNIHKTYVFLENYMEKALFVVKICVTAAGRVGFFTWELK